jgi:RimJ/RimL family protein N-acetyltransferase
MSGALSRNVQRSFCVTRESSLSMNKEIGIRTLHEEDTQAFLDLLTRIDSETQFMLFEAGERRTRIEEQRETIKGLLSKESQTIVVAEDKGQLVGYLVAVGSELTRVRHRAHVVVGVLQAFTGQKIGTRLLTELDAWATQHGITRLELTVRTDNERGIRLYQKMGFEIEGVKRLSLKVNGAYVDEYYMAKIVDRGGEEG